MNTTWKSILAGAVLGAASGLAAAQGADVGLVNMLNGDVNYQSEGAQASKARSFMKVR